MFDHAIGETIYLDRSQCAHFGVDYVEAGTEFVCAADTILRSKAQGYDEKHINLLKPLRGATVIAEGTGHGWFKITSVLPGMF